LTVVTRTKLEQMSLKSAENNRMVILSQNYLVLTWSICIT